MSAPALVLVGPMGAGKTRVGKRVARLLETAFADTDKMVVAEHGPIAALFAEHGEPYFRELERAAVVRALGGDGVVSLGGGAVLDATTRADLSGLPVVLLTVSPRAVEGRLGEGKRPLIRDGVNDWERIYAERKDLYEEVADLVVDTSFRPFDAIAEEVAAWVRTTA
ncbi:MAG TPA: shikimate kinase [Pseudolysinimonas sp.]|nr:shikimate kinase [Pseudolysinimonas sp.]